MDESTFNMAKQAYNAQNWESAVLLFSQCGTGPGTGEACHLCGNALMRLGRGREAIQAYRAAVADPQYKNQGAVYTNLGKAQMQQGDLRGAIDSLNHALGDSSYQGAYKAYIALGEAYSHMGDARNAGVAFRKAALEANNPDPAKSLINLGVCFMQLRRPADAVEAYRTALDFSGDEGERLLLNANLGQAYVASNRMGEAIQAFETALSGGYQITPAARADYERALQVMNDRAAAISGQPGQAAATDPFGTGSLDMSGSAGFNYNPDDSDFFTITEKEIIASAEGEKVSRHIGLKILIVILALLLVATGLAVVAYVRGYGIPSQEDAISTVFEGAWSGADVSSAWVDGVSRTARQQAMDQIAAGSGFTIKGLDATMGESVAVVDVNLPQGGSLSYKVSLLRDGVGWKVSDVQRIMAAVTADTYAGVVGGVVQPQAAPVEAVPDEAAQWTEEQAWA